MPLATVRARVDELRAAGGEPLALALIDLAEAEPVLGHRHAAVRAPLEQAAALIDALGRGDLEGRILLRLASVKLADADLEGTEQLCARARERLLAAGDDDRAIEAGALLARASIRRDAFDDAEARIRTFTEQLNEPTTLPARRTAAMLALTWSELSLARKLWVEAAERLDVLLAEPRDDPDELADVEYAALQGRSFAALSVGDVHRACHALRQAVVIAKRAGGLEDELESRIALAGALVTRGDPTALDEAERYLQIARDESAQAGLESIRAAALVGQAGLLAKLGKTHAAMARCVELAELAATQRDLPRYAAAVALMSQLYEQKGDLASAYRTFAEANAELRNMLGDGATDVIRPHVAAFADRIGFEKFAEIAERVNKASHAQSAFRRLT
jgi:tetratricopeptide (TPR) repeat protein